MINLRTSVYVQVILLGLTALVISGCGKHYKRIEFVQKCSERWAEEGMVMVMGTDLPHIKNQCMDSEKFSALVKKMGR